MPPTHLPIRRDKVYVHEAIHVALYYCAVFARSFVISLYIFILPVCDIYIVTMLKCSHISYVNLII